MNSVKPYISEEEETERDKQYRVRNKDIIAERSRLHAEKNKECIAEKNKTFRANNKEIFSLRAKLSYEKHKDKILHYGKECREENKLEIAEKKKVYYQKVKDARAEQNKVKVCCVFCQKEMRKDSMCKHLKICKMNL